MADRAGPLNPRKRRGASPDRPAAKPVPNAEAGLGGLPFSPVYLAILAVVVLECAWLSWYWSQPFPNYPNPQLTRWFFLERSVPLVFVDKLSLAESNLGLVLKELSHVENLPQRLPIVAAAGFIALAVFGLGGLILRFLKLTGSLSRAERLVFGFGIGASVLGVITLFFGRLGLLTPWSSRLGPAAIAATEAGLLVREFFRSRQDERARRAISEVLPALGFATFAGPFLILMALASMLPTVDFDAIEYHLQGPKEYYQAGRIAFLEHNVYTSMPFGVEMLHLLGMEVVDDWWLGALVGQFLIALHAPMAAAAVALTARRLGSPRAAWFGALVYLTTPWVYRLGVLPYVEGPLAYHHAALVYAGILAWQESDHLTWRRLWAVAGLIAGGAMACKYPALISAVIPFGAVSLADSLRRRSLGPVVAFSIGCAVVMTPWLAKNVIDTGNPVYPLGYKVFGARYWDGAMEQKFSNGHAMQPVTAKLFRQSVVDVAGRSDWQSPLYLALAPLALLRRESRKAAMILWLYIAYLFMTWWLLTHRLDRFWLPILPVAAVLAGLGADWTRRKPWVVFLALMIPPVYLTNLSYSSSALTAMTDWTDDLRSLKTSVPKMLDPALFEADTSTPPGSKILVVGQAAVFHMNHPIVYNTVFDEEIFETIAREQSPEDVRIKLTRLGVTHIYVDWYHIDRFRSPGNYGYTDFTRPAEFERLVKAGVLEKPVTVGTQRELYKVRPAPSKENR